MNLSPVITAGFLMIAAFALHAGETERPAEKEPVCEVLDSGWIRCEALTLGLQTKLGRAYLRKEEKFDTELFFEQGVATSLQERLPARLRELLKNVQNVPSGFPPEFVPPQEDYQFFREKFQIADPPEVLFKRLGTPFAGKPLFDLYSMRPLTEYYWKRDKSAYVFGSVDNNGYLIEKMMLKKIPLLWR